MCAEHSEWELADQDDGERSDFEELLSRIGYEPTDRVMLATDNGGRFASRACRSTQKASELIRQGKTGGNWWVTTNRMRPLDKGRGKASDVIQVMALTVDIDFKDGGMGSEELSWKLTDRLSQVLGTRPCAVVRTGGGLQPYWPLTGGDDIESAAMLLRRWRILVERESAALGGAVDNTFDLPRVLRAPGSLNHKYDPPRPVVTEFEESGDWQPVSVQDAHDLPLDAAVPAVETVQDHAEIVSAEQDWQPLSGACEYVSAMISGWIGQEPPATGGRHSWMVSQATRLAAARRLGCLSEDDLTGPLALLSTVMASWVADTGDTSRADAMDTEVDSAYRWAVQQVEMKTDQECSAELGDHVHSEDPRPVAGSSGPKDASAQPDGTPRPALRRYSDINSEPVGWLWPGRIPLGKITVIDGDPGTGKSTMAVDLAAHVSTGSPWPDGSPCPLGSVILLTAEDGAEDTVRPRLDAAGADPDRVLEFTGTIVQLDSGLEEVIPLDLSHLDTFEAACVTAGDVKLIVVDVFMAYLPGQVDSHRDQGIRRLLAPLIDLANRMDVAVVLLRHLNKAAGRGNPMYRGGGSIGIVGAARAGYVLARDPDDDDTVILACTKMNVSEMPDALRFRLVDASEHGCARVEWLGTTDMTASDLLRDTSDQQEMPTDELVDAIIEIVSANGGRLSAKEAEHQVTAKVGKTGKNALTRAKKKAGVRSVKGGFEDGWLWVLEDAEGPQDPVSP